MKRAIVPAVVLPAMSTDRPPSTLTHLQFLENFVLAAPKLKEDANVGHLLAWGDALEAMREAAEATLGGRPTAPKLPEVPAEPGEEPAEPERREAWIAACAAMDAWEAAIKPLVESHARALLDHELAVGKATEGLSFEVPDESFAAGMAACKALLDDRFAHPPPGTHVPEVWARRMLRLYWSTLQG